MDNSEQPSEQHDPYEQARKEALDTLIDTYLNDDDKEFLLDIPDQGERLEYFYGRSLEMGEDPDTILREYGITEADDEI